MRKKNKKNSNAFVLILGRVKINLIIFATYVKSIRTHDF